MLLVSHEIVWHGIVSFMKVREDFDTSTVIYAGVVSPQCSICSAGLKRRLRTLKQRATNDNDDNMCLASSLTVFCRRHHANSKIATSDSNCKHM